MINQLPNDPSCFQHSALSLMLSASLYALGAMLQGRANFFMDATHRKETYKLMDVPQLP